MTRISPERIPAGGGRHSPPLEGGPPPDWRALTAFDLYRLFVSLALTVGLPLLPMVSALQADLAYLITAGAYGLSAALFLLLIHLRWPAYPLQLALRWLVDLVAFALLIAYVGGVGQGLEVLLVAEVSALALLAPGRATLGAAASAVLLLLGLTAWLGVDDPTTYYQAALVGLALFAVALLGSALGRRLRQSEALAEQRGQNLASLARLTDHIIQRLDSGIVVVDEQHRVRLMNEAAWFLLGNPVRRGQGMPLEELSPPLATQLSAWEADPQHRPLPLSFSGAVTVQPRFTALGGEGRGGVLIFLEDVSALHRHAQDLKLSSMGRFAMSLAHELRNPLGAISHAVQLLEESPQLTPAERHLLDIVRRQSRRMNGIIENVLDLSRRGRARPQVIDLRPWVEQLVEELRRDHPEAVFQCRVDPADTRIYMDPGHLQQVMLNLCHNALRYGTPPSGPAYVLIRGGRSRESQGPYLEVVDRGPGIDPTDVPHLFEPFYTTEAQGTGLGLYIARELCEANRAHLEYVPVPAGGSCFRITFTDPPS